MQKLQTPFLYLALCIMQSLHSAEEIITPLYIYFPIVTRYLNELTGVFPIVTMEAETFVILNMLIITVLLFLGPFVFLEKSWALQLANIVAAIEILNGIAHVSAAIFTVGYWPGCVSGVGLVILGILVLVNAKRYGYGK